MIPQTYVVSCCHEARNIVCHEVDRMLRPIPTPHPIITFGSLTLIAGMVFYELRSGLEKPEPWLTAAVVISVVSLCEWSRNRRAKAINQRYPYRPR